MSNEVLKVRLFICETCKKQVYQFETINCSRFKCDLKVNEELLKQVKQPIKEDKNQIKTK